MLLFAAGVFLLGWRSGRKLAWRLLLVPSTAVAVWALYLRLRLVGIPGTGGAPENFSLPFVGLLEAFRAWFGEPVDLATNISILGIVVTFAFLAPRSRLPIAWGAMPFVGLVTILSINVLREPFDFARVVVPVFTAGPFLLVLRSRATVLTFDRLEEDG
jgi:hypothetical protein